MVKPKRGKKKWYKIFAPESFGGVELGETPAYSPEDTIGRVVELTVPFVTGDFSKNHILLYFQIVDASEEGCKTKIKKYKITEEYLRSIVRRRSSRIDVIIDTTFKDEKKARIKALVITQGRANGSQKKAIRKKVMEIIEKEASEKTFEEFVLSVLNNKVQDQYKKELHKIFPIKIFDFRVIETK